MTAESARAALAAARDAREIAARASLAGEAITKKNAYYQVLCKGAFSNTGPVIPGVLDSREGVG